MERKKGKGMGRVCVCTFDESILLHNVPFGGAIKKREGGKKEGHYLIGHSLLPPPPPLAPLPIT